MRWQASKENEMKLYRDRIIGDPRHGEGGYTLMEILIVLALLALIAGFAVPNLMKVFGGAKTDAAAIQINNLGAVLDIYRLENGAYPTSEQGLKALVTKPADAKTWNGPYLDKESALTDPWNNAYRYRVPGQRSSRGYDLYSYGADNAEGGEGEESDVWQ